MELRHLRYFIAVAEERHFTRAAERVGIQQPPLSKQIHQLEQELGTPLFTRLTRGVELTEAGEQFLPEARAILEQVERSQNDIRQLSRGTAGRLRIGFAGATYFEPGVPALVRDYRLRYPNVRLQPEQSNTALLLAKLQAGEIDAAFVRAPFEGGAAIESRLLVDEAMVAAVPADHPLAGSAAIELAALAAETFILFPRAISPGLYDSLIAACQRAGFSPRLGQEAPQIVSTVPMVAAGFGVSLVPASLRQIRADGVRYLALSQPAPRAPIHLACRRDARSAALRNLLALCDQAAT